MTPELLINCAFAVCAFWMIRQLHRARHQSDRWEYKAHENACIADAWENKARLLDELVRRQEHDLTQLRCEVCPVCAQREAQQAAHAKVISFMQAKIEALLPGMKIVPLELVAAPPDERYWERSTN